MKTMTAKYAGKCRTCGGRIEAGDTIRWGRAEGANHFDRDLCGIRNTAVIDGFGDEFDAEDALIRREEAEYQRGYHEVAQIQAVSSAGSVWRDALYAEMEMAAYNRGEDY
jgi:hypothetical protein